MKELLKLNDNYYPFTGVDKIRNVARAILFNDAGEIFLHHVISDDLFGHRDCYETPGGGINHNEKVIDALKREVLEETGYDCEVICEIGLVIDYYNLIKRKNKNYYFLCKAKTHHLAKKEAYEKKIIVDSKFYKFDEAIDLCSNHQVGGVGLLIKNRELPIIKIAKIMVSRLI